MTKFSLNDVREAMPKSDIELLCNKNLWVQLIVIRPSDDDEEDGLSRKFGLEITFSPTEDRLEDAFMNVASFNRLFTLEELTAVLKVFGIEQDAEVWQVTDDFDGNVGEPRIISDVSQIKEVKP